MAVPVHYPIGSMWCVWDLHFHTPSSYDYKDKSVTNEGIVHMLLSAGISVVAITDHHVIDTQRIRELQVLGQDQLVVLPGIEVRTELSGTDSVHMVAVFPEDCDIDAIWDKLRVNHNLAQQIADRGHDSVYVDFREFADDVHKLNGLTIIHAGTKTNSIEEIANSTAFKMALKTDLAREASDIFEIANPKNISSYIDIVFPAIGKNLPLILCSDSHRLSDYAAPPCWIKADPSFYGLCQVIYDPSDRVHLADQPESLTRISQNKTKYMKSVSFSKADGSHLSEAWFDGISVPLNPGLIAIIGNKGSGKSALAETIGLLGGCRHTKDFSFLHKDRFLSGRDSKGSHFTAALNWLDGTSTVLTLSESNDSLEERVRYIPQNYLETVCNALQMTDSGEFGRQLEHVILSHVPPAERAGHETLQSLVDYLTAEIEDSLKISRQKVLDLNARIVEIEQRISPNHKTLLQQGLESKQNDLRVLEDARPSPISKPSDDPNTSTEMKEKVAEAKRRGDEVSGLEELVRINNRYQLKEKQATISCTKLLQAIANFETQYEDLRAIWEKEGISAGVDMATVVQVTLNRAPLDNRLKASGDSLNALQADMDLSKEGSLASRLAQTEEALKTLHSELTAPEQAYQKYLAAEKAWVEKQKQVLGDKDTPRTIVWYQQQLEEIKLLPEELKELQDKRTEMVGMVFSNIEKWRDVYKQAYGPVQKYIDEHAPMSERVCFEFSAFIADIGLNHAFFDIVHQGRRGSFCRDGEAMLRKLIDDADFSSVKGVISFVREVLVYLDVDKRPGGGGAFSIEDQFKDGKTRVDLYNLLFSLDYLRPTYSLRWSGKDLDQLSPGEKGTPLLIFYLLIDKGTGPLLIDQPEENLDNQTVFSVLVPCINEARHRRQIVLVTHNPNLAIVCDADQIIRAKLDVDGRCQLSYDSGAIENPIMSAAVVDVLEGTKPAFEKREHKYVAAMPDWKVKSMS